MFLLNFYDFQLLSFQELNDEKLLKKLWNMKKPNACSRTRALARFLTKQKMFASQICLFSTFQKVDFYSI